MSKEIKSLVVPGGREFTPEEQRDIFRSVHSAMVEKPSSFTHYIKKSVQVTIQDIEQACIKVSQYFSNYDIINNSFSAEIQLEDGEFYRSSNLSDFKRFDESQNSAIDNISIELQYLIMSPKSERPFTFKISIHFRTVESFFLTDVVEVPVMLSSNIHLTIEHSDYVIAKSLKLHIDEWIKSLDEQEHDPLARKIRALFKIVEPISGWMIGFGVSLAAFLYFYRSGESGDMVVTISFFMFVYFALRASNVLLVRTVRESTLFHLNTPGFKITRGDKKNIEEKRKKIASNRRVISFLFGTLLINIMLSLFSAYFYELVKPLFTKM